MQAKIIAVYDSDRGTLKVEKTAFGFRIDVDNRYEKEVESQEELDFFLKITQATLVAASAEQPDSQSSKSREATFIEPVNIWGAF